MKHRNYLMIAIFFFACNSAEQKVQNSSNKETVELMTEVAKIGLFEKLEYKFTESQKNTKGLIELSLYNSHIAMNSVDEENIAFKSAKEFVARFKNANKYDSILVRILVTEKDEFNSIQKETNFRYLTGDL